MRGQSVFYGPLVCIGVDFLAQQRVGADFEHEMVRLVDLPVILCSLGGVPGRALANRGVMKTILRMTWDMLMQC